MEPQGAGNRELKYIIRIFLGLLAAAPFGVEIWDTPRLNYGLYVSDYKQFLTMHCYLRIFLLTKTMKNKSIKEKKLFKRAWRYQVV